MRYATDYDTGERVGVASPELAQASDEAVRGSNGAVLAYVVRDLWRPLPADREADFRRMGYTVATVYVMPEGS